MSNLSNPFEVLEQKQEAIDQKVDLILAILQVKPVAPKTERPINQQEACEFLGKSRQSLINWRKKGLIQAYRINGRIFYKPSELLQALEKI